VHNIRAQAWYNGDRPHNLNGFLNDKTNRLIGWPTMRQLRIETDQCNDQRIRQTCLKDYQWYNEDRRSYQPEWTSNIDNRTFSQSILRSFQYQSSKELDTYVYIGDHGRYGGGGYVYEFRGALSDIQRNISLLQQLQWIDNRTRAILIQLTLYNPNNQLLTSVSLLAEILSTGGIYPSARFEPIPFYGRLCTVRSNLLRTILHAFLLFKHSPHRYN
jgi:hypothetical protein